MNKKFEIVTLCGSTKFKEDFIVAGKELTLKGKLVISENIFGHSGDEELLTEDIKEMLKAMHKQKIDMSDTIFVINKDGYIGENTKEEIKYAKLKGKNIEHLENCEYDI